MYLERHITLRRGNWLSANRPVLVRFTAHNGALMPPICFKLTSESLDYPNI